MTTLIDLSVGLTWHPQIGCITTCPYGYDGRIYESQIYSFHSGDEVDFGTLSLHFAYEYPTNNISLMFGNYFIDYTPPSHMWDLGPTGLAGCTGPAFVQGICTLPPNPPPQLVPLHLTFTQDTSVQISWVYADYFAPAVPEPATWLLMILGLLSVGIMRAFAHYRYTPVPQEGATL